MTIFTDRDLERMASLRVNWRKEFLLEVLRLGGSGISQKAGIACHRPRRAIFVLPPSHNFVAPDLVFGARLIQ
jgi:hypothetical protein